MASYIVLEPGTMAAERAERAILIRDGFAFLAFIAPLIWFLWHRMWLEALAVFTASLALAALGTMQGYGAFSLLLSLLLSLFVGLEARGLRAAALGRRGWNFWGVVEGQNRSEAELRYTAEVDIPAVQKQATATAPTTTPQRKGGLKTVNTSFGLLDYPRRS